MLELVPSSAIQAADDLKEPVDLDARLLVEIKIVWEIAECCRMCACDVKLYFQWDLHLSRYFCFYLTSLTGS